MKGEREGKERQKREKKGKEKQKREKKGEEKGERGRESRGRGKGKEGEKREGGKERERRERKGKRKEKEKGGRRLTLIIVDYVPLCPLCFQPSVWETIYSKVCGQVNVDLSSQATHKPQCTLWIMHMIFIKAKVKYISTKLLHDLM